MPVLLFGSTDITLQAALIGPLQRILRGVSATLGFSFYSDGTIIDPGSATVTITASDGTAVATSAATTEATAGVFTYTLTPAQTAQLDTLTVVWQATVGGQVQRIGEKVEIAGGFLFTIAEARALSPLDNTTNFTTADIVSTRTAVEQALEQACGVAFVPRYALEVVQGSGYKSGLIPTWPKITAVRSASIDGSPVTLAGNVLLRPDGTIDYYMGWSSRTAFPYVNAVTVGYEHGYDVPPGEIKRAALKLAKAWLVGRRNPIDDRAVTFSSTDGGTYSLAVPGRNGSYFGDPDVDAAIDRYSFDVAVW